LDLAMFRPILLALSLLLPAAAIATPPPPSTPEALAQASDWFVGHWFHESHLAPPDYGPGTVRADMEVRPDRSIEMSGTFTPDGATAPMTSFHMTATWWMERAEPAGLRVRLEETMYSEDGGPPQPGDLVVDVMNLLIQPDGTLVDRDDGIPWTREAP
jgi:hypothetical protein